MKGQIVFLRFLSDCKFNEVSVYSTIILLFLIHSNTGIVILARVLLLLDVNVDARSSLSH